MAIAARIPAGHDRINGTASSDFKDELHRVVVDVVDLSRIDRWSDTRLRDEVLGFIRS